MIPSCQIICGDALTELRKMASESVHCVVTSPPYLGLRRYLPEGHPDEAAQIGLEPDPETWAARLVEVFREVRRVLHPTGTLWINCGDAYASAWPCHRRSTIGAGSLPNGKREARPSNLSGDLKEKDLIGLPWLLAFALRAEGWWLRSAITWCKVAPMAESCQDRPTSATEMIFLFAKSPRYFYDQSAIRTPIKESTRIRLSQPTFDSQTGGPKDTGNGNRSHRQTLRNQHEKLIAQEKWDTEQGANLRNFWLLSPESFPDAHFATFPTEIPRRAILLGASARGVCPECGEPWRLERVASVWPDSGAQYDPHDPRGSTARRCPRGGQKEWDRTIPAYTTGWHPGCSCGRDDTRPAVVLDPFSGSGTTGLVALQLGRSFVGIELSEEYCRMAERRLAGAMAQGVLELT